MGCPVTTSPSFAATTVKDGYELYKSFALSSLNDTINFINQLASYEPSAAFSALTFPTPERPEYEPIENENVTAPKGPLPEGDLENELTSTFRTLLNNINSWKNIYSNVPKRASLPYAPSAPALQIPGAPDFARAYPDVPDPEKPSVPDAPSVSLPDLGDLQPIDIDALLSGLPSVDVTSEIDSLPEAPADPGGITPWTEPTYDASFLDTLESTLSPMLAGQGTVPDSIWRQIWDRARDQSDALLQERYDEADADFVARGFEAPQGFTQAMRDAAWTEAERRVSEASREAAIKHASQVLEQIKFAVQQGISLEDLRVRLFMDQTRRMFEAFKFVYDYGLNLARAKATLYNLRLERLKALVAIVNESVGVELSKLDARIKSQDLEIRNAEMQTRIEEAKVDVYAKQVQAAVGLMQLDKAHIDAIVADIRAYGEYIQAQAQVYKAVVDANKAPLDVFRSQVDLYQAKSRAAVDMYRADIEQYRSDLQKQIDLFRLQQDKLLGLAETISRSADTITKVRTAEQDLSLRYAQFLAEIDKTNKFEIPNAAEDSYIRQLQSWYNYHIQRALASADEVMKLNQLQQDKLKSIVDASAALSSGAMAAVDLSASISTRESYSQSCSESYNIDEF